MAQRQISPAKTTLEIRRPSGEIAMVDITTKYPLGINEIILGKYRAATTKAGRGYVICSHYTPGVIAMTAHDIESKEYDRAHNAVVKAMSY